MAGDAAVFGAPIAAAPLAAPNMSWTKADLLDYANSVGVEVSSSLTKAQILTALGI